MRTTELFKFNRSPKRINESLEKVFGKKINFENFDTTQLEDARNKLRTQIHSARSQSGFNENIENDALTQAQWMHDAIVAELMDRQEHIVDVTQFEEANSLEDKVAKLLKSFDENMNEIGGYGDPDQNKIVALLRQGDVEGAIEEVWYNYADQDGGELRNMDNYIEDLQDEFEYLVQGEDGDEGGETDDAYALASAGHGSDEDYEDIENEEANKSDIPAYKRKASGNPDWKMSTKDLEDERTKSPTSSAGLARRKKELGMEDIAMEKAPEGWEGTVKAMKKHKDIDNPYALAHYMKNKGYKSHKKESIETGEDMTKLTEGEIQQASAIVTAKTMVDRVGRWIEELSGMENDTLLQLGDSIRDEMGSEQAKTFISQCAPAIQQALENLKQTRETLSTGVRMLTGEEQGAEMLGAEPTADAGMGGEEDLGAAEPDAMNAGGDELGGDEFAAAEPAAGGMETAGREQRESIDRQNRLLKVLAG